MGPESHFYDANNFTTDQQMTFKRRAQLDIVPSDRMTVPLKFYGSNTLKRSGHEPVFAY
ncbi:unannotated protein [freshwater metagenome]|uniref:Unannotated protein n=1 Tax=freshwater metagenome TaxID=449393 RepID=A0A6J6WBL6_9ZZZZ